jgi:SAM-dependent methyltransferase
MKPEFERYAANYSDLLRDPIRDGFAGDPAFFHRRKWMVIRDFLAGRNLDSSKLTWLDVGCGQGELIELAGSNFSRAVGCDPSRAMIKSSGSSEVYEQPSPTELPFADKSFDFITAVCVYHHVHGDARGQLTKSIHRVLKPHGLFCMIEHNPWNPLTQLIVKRCPVDAEAELLSASLARRLVRAADFEVLDTTYFLFLPEGIFQRMGAVERTLRRCPLGGQFAVSFQKSSEPVGSISHQYRLDGAKIANSLQSSSKERDPELK